MLLYFLWLLPLFGAVLLWAFGPQLRSWGGPIGSALVGVSFIATLALWGDATAQGGLHVHLVDWLPGWSFGLLLDRQAPKTRAGLHLLQQLGSLRDAARLSRPGQRGLQREAARCHRHAAPGPPRAAGRCHTVSSRARLLQAA